MLADFHFLRPWWLLAFLPLGIAVVWLARRRTGMRRWENVIDRHLAPYVLIGGAAGSRRLPALLTALAGTLSVLALAGPVWQQLPQPVFASQDALVIVLDLSRSMDTEDIKPSRLARARFKIADVLARRSEGQTALLVYAAEAFTVSPLTDDTATIAAQLPALTTDLMPSQGSRADRALALARNLLEQGGRGTGEILLITDGFNVARTAPAASLLADEGYRVSVLGVGTTEGGPIPGASGFVKRNDGSIVVTTLDRDTLRTVARAGGGIYQDLTADENDLARLAGLFDSTQAGEMAERDLSADVWREEGPWLLLPLLPLVALVFRRGVLAAVALALVLPPDPAYAIEATSLWLRPDQRGVRALEAGEAARAAELFRDPAWAGVAHYRAGEYEEALAALDGLDSALALYNRGNALARLGRFDEALAAYDEVLERDPGHADAEFNRELLLEQMKNQQQDQQQNSSQDQDGENQEGEDQQGDDQQQQQQQQNAQDGQQQDGSDSEQSQQAQQQESAEDGEPSQDAADDQSSQAEEQESEAERQAAEAAESGDSEDGEEPQQSQQVAASDETLDESEQAVEQWLRRIPDDPGGLLRRKFRYQYGRQPQPQAENEQW